MYCITEEEHVTYNFHIGDPDQRAEHVPQMRAMEHRSIMGCTGQIDISYDSEAAGLIEDGAVY